MSKYRILPFRVPVVTEKTFRFTLRNYSGSSARLVLSPNGTYSMSVSGWDDDYIIENRAKRDPQYKSGIQKLSNDMLNDYQAQNDYVTIMSKRSFKPLERRNLERERDKIQMEQYQPKPFIINQPTMNDVTAILDIEANGVHYKSDRKELDVKKYIQDNKSAVLSERMAFWNEIQQLYDDIEKANRNNANKEFKKTYDAKRSVFDDIINGTPSAIDKAFTSGISSLAVPYEIGLDYSYDQNKKAISIDICIPESIDVYIPSQKASLLSSGKISVKDKLQKEIKNDVFASQLSLMYYIASFAFSLSPNIEQSRISLWTKQKDYGYCWINFDKNNFKYHTDPSEFTLIWHNVCQIVDNRGANVLNPIEKSLFKRLIHEQES